MSTSPVIPRTFAQWKHCITVECGIALSPDYVAQRLAVLSQADGEETRRFRQLYGDLHWQAVCNWFAQIQQELAATAAPTAQA